MDGDDEDIVDRRLGRLAGTGALALALLRLGRLFIDDPNTTRWPLLFVAVALLGGVAFWLIDQAFPDRPFRAAALFSLAGSLVFLRVAVPQTLVMGFLPTIETIAPLAGEIEEAFRLIRHGVAPIFPTPGILAVLAVVMWMIGGLFAWGATTGPVVFMFLPALVLYMQLAISDRLEAGLTWTTALMAVLGVGLVALAMQRPRETGKARDGSGRALPRRSPYLALAVTAALGVIVLSAGERSSDLVPSQGALEWRSGGTGYGPGGSGVSFNRLVDLRQRIISRTNQVLFRATLGPDAPPPGEIYWRMETLDTFDGIAWRRSDTSGQPVQSSQPLPSGDDIYGGTTSRILHQVQIDNLRGEGLLPTAGVPVEIHEVTAGENPVPAAQLSILDDSALVTRSGLRRGTTYQLAGIHPDIRSDLGSLATGVDGQLSPLFASAAADGSFTATPGPPPGGAVERPPGLEAMTQLPDGTPASLFEIANTRTAGASTDFERAWLLQQWFRDSGDFVYSTQVSTGHGSLDLENWLADSTSPNYRVGYCEQFAASMAVLSRALGIPARVVWGFTPGTLEPQPDGPDVVVVRDTNAHAWVEVWIDGFGWVPFDPTPRGEYQPASATAVFDPAAHLAQDGAPPVVAAPVDPGAALLGPNQFEDDPPPGGSTREGSRWWLLAPLVAGGGLLVVPLLKAVRRRRRMSRLRNGDVTAAWEEIVDRLNDLGDPLSPGMTPMEVAHHTDPALLSLAVGYSAAVYGERKDRGQPADLLAVEGWLRDRYDGSQRLMALVNPRSLIGGD